MTRLRMDNTTTAAVLDYSTEATTRSTEATTLNPFVGYSLSSGMRMTLLTIGWVACVSGVLGNVLIIATLLSQPALRSLHNLYIGNLAVADLVVAGYSVPFWLVDIQLSYQPVVNQKHCDANAFVMVVCLGASIYTLVLIGCDRWLCVCRPAQYRQFFGRKQIILSCVAMWVVAACAAALPLFRVGNSAFLYSRAVRMCTYSVEPPNNVFSIISTMNLVVPTVLVGFFSASILRYWRQSRNRIEHWTRSQNEAGPVLPADRPAPRLSSSDIALVRSLVLIFALLVICYLPLAVALSLSGRVFISIDTYNALVLLFFMNHMINWIVYGMLNKRFKTGYKRLLSGLCQSSFDLQSHADTTRPSGTGQQTLS